jgi:hypothetical protein
MQLDTFILKIESGEHVGFDETMLIIAENYHYHPTEFSNGLDNEKITNAAGSNEGSCKIFAFAQLNHLDVDQTLGLFGHYYWQEVLGDPSGNSHQNIRNFIKSGWAGIQFKGTVLIPL